MGAIRATNAPLQKARIARRIGRGLFGSTGAIYRTARTCQLTRYPVLWNAESEDCSSIWSAGSFQPPVMRSRDLLGDRKAQTVTASLAVARGIHPVETIEDPGQRFLGNSTPRVGHFQQHFTC